VWERWLRENDSSVPKSLPVVIPIVLYHGAKPWSGPRSLADILDLPDELKSIVGHYVPAFAFLLDDLAAREDASIAGRQAALMGKHSLVALKATSEEVDLEEVFRRLRSLARELLETSHGADAFALVLRYTSQVRNVPPRELLQMVGEVLGPTAGEVAMTTYQQLLAQGKAEGQAEGKAAGRAEGEIEGRRKLVSKQLRAVLRRSKKANALIARLSLCDDAALDRIGLLIVGSKRTNLLSALERLLPRGPK
jgi:hypothetical protein